MYQSNPPLSPKETLPTMYDLPSEDPEEPGVPDQFHIYQPRLLEDTFRPPSYPSDQVFTASDLNLYYDVHHTQGYKRPDWFRESYNVQTTRLRYYLNKIGLERVKQCSAKESYIPNWTSWNLDTEPDGSIYKPDSLYMEGIKLA